MDLTIKASILVTLVCIMMALKNQKPTPPSVLRNLEQVEVDEQKQQGLVYDYYKETCPSAENIIKSTVRELYAVNISVAPALLRLLFHDCFIMGCDASIMLDSVAGAAQIKSEKESIPNLSLKGFDEIDAIKWKLEETCPGVVSCADTLALAARESVLLSGGQFYPVFTGRKDSVNAFPDMALNDIPHPDFDFHQAIHSFASKGFDAREAVALLGAHSTGKVHCDFIRDRLFNFKKTNGPDPSIDAGFLEVLRSECSHPSSTPSPSSPFENRAIRMDYEGAGKGFGEVYYRSLLQGKGLLFVDQQLTVGPETKTWVQTYAGDVARFRQDFGLAMFKLSHLQLSNHGQVRINCRKLN